MKFIDLCKNGNNYHSNWKTEYDSDVFILGTIEPFTYKAEETDDEEVSWFILDDVKLNLLKSKL